MRLSRATTACLLVAPIVTLAVTPAPEARQTTPDAGFEVQQIAPGVHAVLRTDPPGLFPAANSVFIVNADDVVVVDTGGTPSAARALVGALARITTRPV